MIWSREEFFLYMRDEMIWLKMKDHDGEHLVDVNIEWVRLVSLRDLIVVLLLLVVDSSFGEGEERLMIRFVSERAWDR